MVRFQDFGNADAADERDARGTHPLVFGADDKGEKLHTLAPMIFSGGGGAAVMSAYGQFTSALLDSVVRVPEVGGPAAGKKAGTYRCSDTALARWWDTALAVVSRLGASQQSEFWSSPQRGAFVLALSNLRDTATAAELAAFHLTDADLELISGDAATLPTGLAGVEQWFRDATWQRGGLADELDGSLHVAALLEYYSSGRMDFATGHIAGSCARLFAKAAAAASQRAALAAGHSAETWNQVPVATKSQKVLSYLAGCSWPQQLNHWRGAEGALLSDMHDLFIYSECHGVGLAAQRELLSTPARTRLTLEQIPLFWGTVRGAPDQPALQAGMRQLVEASVHPPPPHVTLNLVLGVESMLRKARAHCTGAEWDAKPFADRLAAGVRFVGVRRGVEAAALGGQGGISALLPSSDGKSGSVAGYDKLQLLDLKSDAIYVATKSQMLAAYGARQLDKAVLLGLRGAEGPAGAARLPPLKVFHDLLLGDKDAYLVDKDMEDCLQELRRSLPAFWGRRAAKALGVKLQADCPLTALAEVMAAPSKWKANPPDFYALALVPIRVAAGETEAGVFASHMHTPGAPPYENVAVLGAVEALVKALLVDLGVLDTEVPDVNASGADLASPADLFALAYDLHGTAGSLSTTPPKMGGLVSDALKEFGARRGDVYASHDPKRKINRRLFEQSSDLLSSFNKARKQQADGKTTAATLRAAGFTLLPADGSTLGEPSGKGASGAKRELEGALGAEERGGKSRKEEARKAELKRKEELKRKAEAELKRKEEALKGEPELPRVVAKLARGGDVVHVTGGERGPAGCLYMLAGEDGLAAQLEADAGAGADLCPAWYAAFRSGVPIEDLDGVCGDKSHKPGSAQHPTPDEEFKFATRGVKISSCRVNEDGSKYVKPQSQKGGGGGGDGRGRGKGGGKGGKGPGGGKRALAAAAMLTGTSALSLGPSVLSRPAAASLLLTAAVSGGRAAHPLLCLRSRTSLALGGMGAPQFGLSAGGEEQRAAESAFAEARAIFVADGGAVLPERLGGGGLLAWLLRDALGALRWPLDVIVGEFSMVGLGGELDARAGVLGSVLTIDKRPREGPGLHYLGEAQDVLYERSWRRLFSFAPCTDDALSGAQYFSEKVADGRLWRGVKFFLWSLCAPAAACMGEHPRSELKRLLAWPYQVTQPYEFGPGEFGEAEQKETWLYWRGWPDMAPTDVLPPPYVSRIKRVRTASASDRDALKSRSHPGMMRAIAAHATVEAIIPSKQPDFARELQLLGANYSARFGAESLPLGWDEPHVDFPAWVAKSIVYEPSPGARENASCGVLLRGGVSGDSLRSALRKPFSARAQAAMHARFADGAALGQGPGGASGERGGGEGSTGTRQAAAAEDAPGGDVMLVAPQPQGGSSESHGAGSPDEGAGDLPLSEPPAQAVPAPPASAQPVSCLRGTVWGNCFKGSGHRLSDHERDAVCDLHAELLERIRAGQQPDLRELARMAARRGVVVAGNTSATYSADLAAALQHHRGTQPNFVCAPACMRGARCHRTALLQALALLGPVGGGAAAVQAAPPQVACCSIPPPPAATVLAPVRVEGAELVLCPNAGGSLYGWALEANGSSRDDVVDAAQEAATLLLGPEAPRLSFLAGEWVEPGLVWRVVLCVVGGPLRGDMRAARDAGSAPCTSLGAAAWRSVAALPRGRDGEVAAAALARALVFVRPGPLADARLHTGRGGERWADESRDAAVARPRRSNASALREVECAHAEIREYLESESRRLRAEGDVARAEFFARCAVRVEPVPVREFPEGLCEELTAADLEALEMTPFRRDTVIHKTHAPPPQRRPTSFPPDLPPPTCHASFLLPEVMEDCYAWHDATDRWHSERLAGRRCQRPSGLAWGLDGLQPAWRPFFAAGGVVVFDEATGVPHCLSEGERPLAHGLNGSFARVEFEQLRDQEIVSFIDEGVCLKAQGLPLLQLASNLESLYEADDATGVRSVAHELHEFGKHDETGWYLRAPRPDRARGTLGTATLPATSSPIGAVPKPNGGTRIIIDMGFGYGELQLRNVSVQPLPPDRAWLGGVYAPEMPRRHFSSITTGGGGGLAMPVNVAAGPSKPLGGEVFEAGGRWPWPYEGKSSVPEQAHNDLVLSVPARRARLPIVHLLWDEWKSFHQTSYNAWELIATANTVPVLDAEGNVSGSLRGITNGRMAMGGVFASGVCQREGNAADWATMRRFDARQDARRRAEPEPPAVQQWLEKRRELPHDDYGTQARLACGGYYSDDPKYSCCGPATRVGDLAHAFYDVMGPEGLNYRLAEHTKWLVAGWAAWQGIRMSAMLGLIWLPPRKAMKADEDLRLFAAGRMSGADFVKMMGFLNYLGQVLRVHANLNRLLWDAHDAHVARCAAEGLSPGVVPVRPGAAQSQPVRVWRSVIMNTPGTTLLRVVRRVPPPRGNVTLWEVSSDACMDVTVVDGVVVAKHGAVPGLHDWPGMGGFLHGFMWQRRFSADEIALITIPVAEFMAGVVGLMVYDHEGVLEYAQRIALAIDAEATPRCALQGEAHRAGLLIAHDEFTKLPIYAKYRSRLTGKHCFGAANYPADRASRSRNAEAERLARLMGLEPRWLPLPPEARDYIAAVLDRLREWRGKADPRSCDPKVAGGTAPRFVVSPRPTRTRRMRLSPSPEGALASPCGAEGSPLLPKKFKARHASVTPDGYIGCGAPPAPAAGATGPDASPRVTRSLAPIRGSPIAPLDHRGRVPVLARPIHALLAGAAASAGPLTFCSSLPAGSASVSTDGTASFVVEQRVEQLMAENARSNKPHRFSGDQEALRLLFTAQVKAQARSANESSLAHEQSHLRLYWKPYCDLQRTPYVRPDVDSLSFGERVCEEAWWGGAIPWIAERMPNSEGVVGAALPSSVLKVLRNIRRAHKRQGITTVSLRSAVQATDGLLKDFLLEHGPLALVPKRKEPLYNEEIKDIFAFGGFIGTGRKRHLLDWSAPQYSSLLAMFHTLAQTGMRKAEVSLPAKAQFDKSRLSMLNVRWRVGGVVYDHLTPELHARLLAEGGYALLRPPPSKADPFSLHWGPCTIYLRYSASEPINAARELAREELRRGVDPAKRDEAPLFITGEGVAWRHTELAAVFHAIVVAVRGEERAKQVSMHSWRVYLACALLSQGASFATIQAMLRWRSEDALRIYARMNDFKYADWLSSAQGAVISSVRTTTSATDALSRPPDPGTLAGAMRDAADAQAAGSAEAGFHDVWRARAASAVEGAVRQARESEEQPEIDAYGRLEGLVGSVSSLMLEAERADAEDLEPARA